jgi:hypothetical protein
VGQTVANTHDLGGDKTHLLLSTSSSIGTTTLRWVSACSTIVEHSQQEQSAVASGTSNPQLGGDIVINNKHNFIQQSSFEIEYLDEIIGN